jgi:hypothetical protein
MADTDDEALELPEPETEMVEAPTEESETPPVEEDEVVVTIGGDPEPEPEQQRAPEWVKELRRQSREDKRRIRELERLVQGGQPAAETKPAPGPKPTLESADYDTERYERDLAQWYEKKRQHEADLAAREAAEKAQAEQWQGKLNGYTEKRSSLKVRDFEDAEALVADTLSVTQQGMILAGADNPALLVYALGKNPKRAQELASIQDPVVFAWKAAKLEAELKVSNRKPTTQPERTVTGTAPKSGTVDSNLDRLRAEAERTGDYSKVVAYRKQLKQKGK